MNIPATNRKNTDDISSLCSLDNFSTFSKKGSIDLVRPFLSIISSP
jgi:hypothetical protein